MRERVPVAIPNGTPSTGKTVSVSRHVAQITSLASAVRSRHAVAVEARGERNERDSRTRTTVVSAIPNRAMETGLMSNSERPNSESVFPRFCPSHRP
ncbi:hypothetical protein BG842_13185 [Haladaptatus sp. W1]|nr:hypothetical protein BG842_13185 [Haladaptatus sp. W1]